MNVLSKNLFNKKIPYSKIKNRGFFLAIIRDILIYLEKIISNDYGHIFVC